METSEAVLDSGDEGGEVSFDARLKVGWGFRPEREFGRRDLTGEGEGVWESDLAVEGGRPSRDGGWGRWEGVAVKSQSVGCWSGVEWSST